MSRNISILDLSPDALRQVREKLAEDELPKPEKPSKYHNVRCTLDGFSFPSERERDRYAELRILERAGQIRNLKLQPRYPIIVNGEDCGTYVADFSYFRDHETVCEDVKSEPTKTALYKLKKKLVWAIYRVKVVEV